MSIDVINIDVVFSHCLMYFFILPFTLSYSEKMSLLLSFYSNLCLVLETLNDLILLFVLFLVIILLTLALGVKKRFIIVIIVIDAMIMTMMIVFHLVSLLAASIFQKKHIFITLDSI